MDLARPIGSGSVYPDRDFEFDYAGVIWGRARWGPAATTWIGDPSHSHDSIVKRSGGRLTDLVKRTHRVLLTRGLKSSYVYSLDSAITERLDKAARTSPLYPAGGTSQ